MAILDVDPNRVSIKKTGCLVRRRDNPQIQNWATTYSRGLTHYHRRRELNFRVRNGNGCDPSTMVTQKFYS